MSSPVEIFGQSGADLTVKTYSLADANAALADLHHGRIKGRSRGGAGALSDPAFMTRSSGAQSGATLVGVDDLEVHFMTPSGGFAFGATH